jgi:para-nitrobenzyl esterase
MSKFTVFLIASIVVLAAQLAHAAVPAGRRTEVDTTSGPVRGTESASALLYLGIPYAEAPIGALRWQPPKPRRPWKAMRDATRFGSPCPSGLADKALNASEDCLYLNVYVPKRPKAPSREPNFPVMVWIHGGANAGGAGEFYDPTPLLKAGDGVVVVTLNYRLGAFGFLAHPALDAQGHAAVNYGIMDQQLALAWVRDNIGHFGGDPHNVTIFGESAGGLNTTTHLISPFSQGLFHRAIIQSGAYLLDTPSLASSQALGVEFAKRAGCVEQTAKCLRALSPEAILANAGDVNTTMSSFHQATVDGRILPESHRSALAAGRFARVPVLVGNNADEGRLGVSGGFTWAEHQKKLETDLPAASKDPATARALYSQPRYRTAADAASAADGDRTFACTALHSSRLISRWVPTYSYEFADSASGRFGATHAAELKYLFNFALPSEFKTGRWGEAWKALEGRPDTLAPASRHLAEVMQASWTSFARSGKPESSMLSRWPPASQGIQLLAPERLVVESPTSFAERHQCAFWG